MAVSLRAVLVVSAFLVLIFIVRKIKCSQLKAMDAFFWLLFSFSFVALAAFPQVASNLAAFFGFQAASNFVFVYVIAILVVREFSSTIKYAQLRDRLDLLVEEIALDDALARCDHEFDSSDEGE